MQRPLDPRSGSPDDPAGSSGRQPRRRLRAVVAVLLLAGLVGCGRSVRVEETRHLEVGWRSGATLDVVVARGDLRVQRAGPGSPGSPANPGGSADSDSDSDPAAADVGDAAIVRIAAHLRAEGRSEGEARRRLAEATLEPRWTDAGRLLVEPRFPGARRDGDRAAVVVTLPDGAHPSEVRLRAENGTVSLHRTEGRAVLATRNGSVRIDDHHGSATVEVVRGHTVALGVRGPLRVVTTTGGIHATLTDVADGVGGPVELVTLHGHVRVTLPPVPAGSIRASFGDGGFDVHGLSDLADVRLEGRQAIISFATDGPASSAHTRRGIVTIEPASRTDGVVPASPAPESAP